MKVKIKLKEKRKKKEKDWCGMGSINLVRTVVWLIDREVADLIKKVHINRLDGYRTLVDRYGSPGSCKPQI